MKKKAFLLLDFGELAKNLVVYGSNSPFLKAELFCKSIFIENFSCARLQKNGPLEMKNSSYLDEALEIIASVRGKPLSLEERKPLVVELATYILREANKSQTFFEKKEQRQLAKLMQDPLGKAFTVAFTDEGFRSSSYKRIASQLVFLLDKFGIPQYLSLFKKCSSLFLNWEPNFFPFFSFLLPSIP